jgi:predicted TPR repeat methyltransferase
MAAALGGERTRGCPPSYVAQLFDDHAERFEALLVDGLGYSTHRALADLVWDERPSAHFDRVLDLGCGTGLFGVEIRPAARWLGGVDLSERMLAKAAEKSLYDELYQGELPGWLDERGSQFDLLAAADVLPYFGDLEGLVVALGRAAAPAALVGLSIESTPTHPYELRRSGRFAHHPRYLTALACDQGLRLLREARSPLRREGGALVDGFLALFEAI